MIIFCNRSLAVLPYQLFITCNPLSSKRLQVLQMQSGRVRRRTNVLQVPANAAGAVPCEWLLFFFHCKTNKQAYDNSYN